MREKDQVEIDAMRIYLASRKHLYAAGAMLAVSLAVGIPATALANGAPHHKPAVGVSSTAASTATAPTTTPTTAPGTSGTP
jgi:hypothetical protein